MNFLIKLKQKSLFILFVCFTLSLTACNYNYYRGTQLEEEKRYEEANIEYHRAYTQSPGSDRYKEAFERTSILTSEDLVKRYFQYLSDEKFHMAYKRLQQARSLTPNDATVVSENAKWFRILLAGKINFEFQTLKNQIPFTDKMILEARINTPNPSRRLTAEINNQTKIFSVQDILYDPPQNLLMFYSINSIGVKLINSQTASTSFQKFIDFKTPILFDIKGTLTKMETPPKTVESFFPIDQLKGSEAADYWFPSGEIQYSMNLDSNQIKVKSSVGQIDFLPQILYINLKNRRYFLDFGDLAVYQKRVGGLWKYKRIISKERSYMENLKNNLLLNPFFYFREGGYPFVKDLS